MFLLCQFHVTVLPFYHWGYLQFKGNIFFYNLPKTGHQSLGWLHPTWLAHLTQTGISWFSALHSILTLDAVHIHFHRLCLQLTIWHMGQEVKKLHSSVYPRRSRCNLGSTNELCSSETGKQKTMPLQGDVGWCTHSSDGAFPVTGKLVWEADLEQLWLWPWLCSFLNGGGVGRWQLHLEAYWWPYFQFLSSFLQFCNHYFPILSPIRLELPRVVFLSCAYILTYAVL